MSSTEPPPSNHESFTSLLHLAKARYTIRDKSSSQILGYAIMNTDRSVSADEIQLERITWPCAEVQSTEGSVADVPPPSAADDDVMPGSLVTDLDLSQDSSDSMNKTVEEDLSSIRCNENEESPGQIMTDKCDGIPQSVHSSISPSPPVLLDSSPSPAIIKSPITSSTLSSSVSSPKSSPAMLAPNPLYTQNVQNVEQGAYSDLKMSTQSVASDIVDNAKDQAMSSQAGESKDQAVSHGKRKSEDDIEDRQKKKSAVDKRLERASRESLSSFYEHVEEGRETKYKRVKCLLCNDGRLLSLINFSRHIKAIHEPPVPCENCGQVFSGEQLRTHRNRKKCVWQKLEFVEKPASFSSSENKDKVETVSSCLPVEVDQDKAPDRSTTSSLATNTREIRTGLSDTGVSRGDSDQSTASASKSEGGEWVFITLAHHSLEKYRSIFKIEKHRKVKKLMKAFGKEHKIEYKNHLRFYIGSEELTGHEKIGELKLNRGKIDQLEKNGGEIEVFGEIVNM